MPYLLLWGVLLTSLTWAAIPRPETIPRTSTKQYRKQGIFFGGKGIPSNIENVRLAHHTKEGFERWVVDFSDAESRTVGLVAPKFQIHHLGKLKQSPPRFWVMFRHIRGNYLQEAKIAELLKKSKKVKKIIVYPPIEEGDMAIEFILKEHVLLQAHQPLEKEGRLVLDLRT